MGVVAVLGSISPVIAYAGDAPVLPKLESLAAEAFDTAASDEEGTPAVDPAQRMPQMMTVCIDRAALRCWTEAGVSSCGGAEVYGVSEIDERETLAGELLQRCWRVIDSGGGDSIPSRQ